METGSAIINLLCRQSDIPGRIGGELAVQGAVSGAVLGAGLGQVVLTGDWVEWGLAGRKIVNGQAEQLYYNSYLYKPHNAPGILLNN